MKTKYTLIPVILFLILSASVFCAKPKFPISDIPAELKENAKAVVRYSENTFEVRSDKRATHTFEYAISILNKDALDYADLYMMYDKFTRISDISAVVYDEQGNKVRKVPLAEILDYFAFDGFSIYHDNRIKYLDTKYQTIPFTVEFSYTTHYNGLMYYPTWIPNMDFDISVERALFQVTTPADNDIRYKEQNFPVTVEVSSNDNIKEYNWKVSNLEAIKSEPLCLPIAEYAPIVFTAPNSFELDKQAGNMESWENFGQWISILNQDRDTLSAETISLLNNLVKDATSNLEKVEIIYSYLQNNTRYVSIQVGIGGWQPFDAETVDRLKYGDCKALSNYMKTMLKAIGIHSEYALIRAGKNAPRMMKDFPSTQFNHAFLCVPLENDTVWLECTNPYIPCGFLGTFDDDRDVLLITDEGGKVAHTSAYTAQNNLLANTGNVIIEANGNATATMNNCFNGIHYSNSLALILGDDTDKKKQLYKRINIPNFEVLNYTHSQVRERIPCLKETLELTLDSYGSVMGDRIIFPLNLINQKQALPRNRNKRISDIFIRRDISEKDSIVYHIPNGYAVEGLPDSQELSNDFGTYKSSVNVTDSTITYMRYHTINKGTFNQARYQEYHVYVEEICRLDNAKAVLIKDDESID